MQDTHGISVKDFGATGDGVTDDAPSIQAALNSRAGRVLVPMGEYKLCSGLKISSGTTMVAHPAAFFRYADGAGRSQYDFLISNRDPDTGNSAIHIEGGVWDGNNPGNPRGPDAPTSYSGVMFNFTNVQDLTLRALTLVDAESYFVRLGAIRNFLIENIDFDIKHLRPNQDGIHVSGNCEDGIIRNIHGLGLRTPNDDMVALLADDALHRAQNLNGAFNGPIRRIRIEHLHARSCHSFIRLLSVEHPIEDIEIHDVNGGCVCSAINMDACRDCRVKLFDDDDHPDGVGSISNVRISDIQVFKALNKSHQPLIDFRTRVENFEILRFSRNHSRDACPAAASLCIEKAGDAEIRLEGIEKDTGSYGLLAGTDAQNGVRPYLVRRSISASDRLSLSQGGFERLVVTKANQLEG